jgi:hypothetical protein
VEQQEIKTVVILGMHRSGTSMVTGILSKLGVDVGKRLLYPNAANPLGYFEDVDFFELNKQILRAAGGSWKAPPDIKDILAQRDEFSRPIRNLIKRKESKLWGWKDPRTSLTIELYLPFLTNAHFIVCHRDSKEVARSLAQRENWKIQRGIRLKKAYDERINSFFEKCNRLNRFDINYENIISNSEEAIDDIIGFLGIEVDNDKYEKTLKMILTPKDIQKLRNKTKKQLKSDYNLYWGNDS